MVFGDVKHSFSLQNYRCRFCGSFYFVRNVFSEIFQYSKLFPKSVAENILRINYTINQRDDFNKLATVVYEEYPMYKIHYGDRAKFQIALKNLLKRVKSQIIQVM